jgi:hypothetical protein
LDKEKTEAIENLIGVFAREFPRRNHIILEDKSDGHYRVDEVQAQGKNSESQIVQRD